LREKFDKLLFIFVQKSGNGLMNDIMQYLADKF